MSARDRRSDTGQIAAPGGKWNEEDFGGDISAAERYLFTYRILKHMRGSTAAQLFREIDKSGSGELDHDEFKYGMQYVVGSGCSELMLRLIFNRMDTGDDHLGILQFSDQSIAFKEFMRKIKFYKEEVYAARARSRYKDGTHQEVEDWLAPYNMQGEKMAPAGRSEALQTLDALSIDQPPVRRSVKVQPAEWEPDDCYGNVEKAERELFRKLLVFLEGGRNMPTLFRRMNVNEDGRLEEGEWRGGCRAITGCRMSDYMLDEIFERMDGCDDASNDMISPDACLSFSEMKYKLMEYKRIFRLEGWTSSPYWGRSLTPKEVSRPRSSRCEDPRPPGTLPMKEWHHDEEGNWFEKPKSKTLRSRPSTAGSARSARSSRSKGSAKSPRKSQDPACPWSPGGFHRQIKL